MTMEKQVVRTLCSMDSSEAGLLQRKNMHTNVMQLLQDQSLTHLPGLPAGLFWRLARFRE